MGNSFMRQPEEQHVQSLQNQYFTEYKIWGLQNMEELKRESNRWQLADKTIRTLSLQEQSEYADYVTKKMCANHPEVFETYYNMCIRDMRLLGPSLKYQGSCAIGNMALILSTIPEGDFRNKALEDFQTYLKS